MKLDLRCQLLLTLVISLASDMGSVANAQGSQRGDNSSSSAPVLNENIDLHWLGDDDRYAWYEAERPEGAHEVVVIDTRSGERLKPEAFPDGVPQPKITRAGEPIQLNKLDKIERSRPSDAETEVAFINETTKDVELVWVDPQGNQTSYGTLPAQETRKIQSFAGHVWVIRDRNGRPFMATRASSHATSNFVITKEELQRGKRLEDASYERRERERSARAVEPRVRPEVFLKEHNVWLKKDGVEMPITEDGTASDGYEGGIEWSPTNEHFWVRKTKFVKPRQVTLVDSAPDDQLQPKTIVIDYVKPGDELEKPRIHVFSADGKTHHAVEEHLAPNPFEIRNMSWREDGSALRFVYNERGHGRLSVIEIKAKDGKCRVMVDEVSQTFVDYAGKFYLEFLDDTNELIWMSERDGWNHLYLIDQASGDVKRQITKGEWVVREVVEFDRDSRTMLVSVGGYVSGEDPYYRHLLRVSLDGGNPIKLTDGDGDHQWKFSPTKKFFVDRYSRVDLPPVTAIRSRETGKLVAPMETADASSLIGDGWTLPKRFTAKARDGKTDIYGLVVFPSGFDESKKYPVLELIYAGPHGAHVPKPFQRLYDLHQTANGVDGKQFIVVRIDGMGTSYRSKAFHDVCWKNLGDGGFPDRIRWMQAAAKEIPQMDIERVGIWGGSAGGQNAMRALVAHGDFYKAAFADCGCHDNRMDKIWWNELWMSWPIGPHYEEQSNVTQAHRITGKLMLSVGELDSNVDPSSTYQVVDALIKADKDFELLLFPGAEHGAGSSPYADRRRIDFFRRSLHEE